MGGDDGWPDEPPLSDQSGERPVVRRDLPHTLLGLVTLVDLLRARLSDLQEERVSERTLHLREFTPLSRGLRAQREETVVAD